MLFSDVLPSPDEVREETDDLDETASDNITAELDLDDGFDPTKLSFHPSVNLDCQICEDDVFLSCLRYDNEEIYPEHEYEEDDIDHVYYKIMSYDDTRWNDNRWEE